MAYTKLIAEDMMIAYEVMANFNHVPDSRTNANSSWFEVCSCDPIVFVTKAECSEGQVILVDLKEFLLYLNSSLYGGQ
jgi:hypothetical protein